MSSEVRFLATFLASVALVIVSGGGVGPGAMRAHAGTVGVQRLAAEGGGSLVRAIAGGAPDDLALGLTRSPSTGEALLKPFAESVGAKTWSDPAFEDIVAQRMNGASWQSISEQIIDRTVAGGGRLHFNLAELDQASPGVTTHELQYILNDPALTEATSLYGDPAP